LSIRTIVASLAILSVEAPQLLDLKFPPSVCYFIIAIIVVVIITTIIIIIITQFDVTS